MSTLPEKTQAWLPEPLSAEVRSSVERLARVDDVQRIALMPDVHLAENVCVGAVVASRAGLYPDAVGGDIGCGMASVASMFSSVKADSHSLMVPSPAPMMSVRRRMIFWRAWKNPVRDCPKNPNV